MSDDNMCLSRRHFLLSALISLVAGCSGARHLSEEAMISLGAEPGWLAQIINDFDAAASLGRTWLATHPGYHRSDMLVAEINQALAHYDASAAVMSSPQKAAVVLQKLVSDEYIHNNVEVVDGWVLSATEIRLYALAALM
jgi:hypothetical protein